MQRTPLLDRLAQRTRDAYDADRRANPDRFTGSVDGLGPNFMFAANVARMLGCNLDFVRRIPRHALPAHKAGQRLIYSRGDVEAYVRSQRDAGAAPMPLRGTMALPAPAKNDNGFDPVAMVRDSMGRKGR